MKSTVPGQENPFVDAGTNDDAPPAGLYLQNTLRFRPVLPSGDPPEGTRLETWRRDNKIRQLAVLVRGQPSRSGNHLPA